MSYDMKIDTNILKTRFNGMRYGEKPGFFFFY